MARSASAPLRNGQEFEISAIWRLYGLGLRHEFGSFSEAGLIGAAALGGRAETAEDAGGAHAGEDGPNALGRLLGAGRRPSFGAAPGKRAQAGP